MANFQDALDRAFPSDKPAASPSGSANSNVSAFVRDVGPIAERVGAEIGVDPSILIGQWGLETRWGKSVIPGTNNYGNIKDFRGSGVVARDNMNGSVDKYRAFKTGEEFADHFVGLLTRKYGNALNSGDDALAYGTALRRNGYAEDPNYAAKIASAADMVRKAGGKGQASIYAPRGEFIGQTEKVIRDSKKQQEIADEGIGTAFAKGFGDATDQIPELAVGAGTALADVFGLDELREAGLGYLQKNKEQAQDEARSYASFTDSLENGDMGRWATYALGYGVNQLAQAAITGGVGATVGKVGLVGLLKGTAERVTAEALAKGAAQEVAAKAGMEAAELAAKKYGAAFAMYGNTYGQELGSIYPDAVEQSQKTGNPVDLARVFGAAGVAAALEVAPEIGIAGKLIEGVGKGSKRMVGRAATTIPKQMGLEGGTEYLQTGAEQWGAQKPLDTPEAQKERIDSAAMGAIMGGPAGAIEAIPAPRDDTATTVPGAVPGAAPGAQPAGTQPAQPTITPNSPLANAASIAQAAHTNLAAQQQALVDQEAATAAPDIDPAIVQQRQQEAVRRQAMASQRAAAGLAPDYSGAEDAESEIASATGIHEQDRILEMNRLMAEEQADLAERRGDMMEAQRIRQSERQHRESIQASRARNSVGAPSGSFGQMNEFADFLGQEQQDIAARRQVAADRQAEAQRNEALRAQSELEAADARVVAQMAKESEQRRRAVLDAILADPATVNPAARLAAELKRQGFRDTTPTQAELDTIQRFSDIQNAEAEPDIIPSSPNELDPYQVRQERPQQPAKPRLTVEQIKQAIANGATLSKDVLTLPDGSRVKLKGPQIAAARQAILKKAQDGASNERPNAEVDPQAPESGSPVVQGSANAVDARAGAGAEPQDIMPAGVDSRVGQNAPDGNGGVAAPQQVESRPYTPPASTSEVSDSWLGVWKRGATPNQDALMSAVQKALNAGLFYNNDVKDFVAKELGVTDAERAVGSGTVDGGAFGYDVYHARKELDRRAAEAANSRAVDELGLSTGVKLGVLVFNDSKVTKAVEVESVAEDKQSVTIKGKRGNTTVSGPVSPIAIKHAIDRAVERGARKPDATLTNEGNTTQSVEPPAESFDVSTRTDDQLRYLAEKGKDGWREAAQVELAKRTPADVSLTNEGKTTQPVEPEAKNVDPLDKEISDAAAHLADVLADVFGAKLNITGPQHSVADLLPAMQKVIGLLIQKGFKTFAQAVGQTARMLRDNGAGEHVEKITPRQWKAAYQFAADMPGVEGAESEESVAAQSADKVQAIVSGHVDKAKAEAEARTDTNPSDAQKEAENYRKGKFSWNGQTIAVENPKGSERTGKGEDGTEWRTVMPATYGYFLGTVGADKDHVDVFMGDTLDAPSFWVINQTQPDSAKFDEHKVVAGVTSADEAKRIYLDSFSDGFGDKVFSSIAGPYPVGELADVLPKLKAKKPFGVKKESPRDAHIRAKEEAYTARREGQPVPPKALEIVRTEAGKEFDKGSLVPLSKIIEDREAEIAAAGARHEEVMKQLSRELSALDSKINPVRNKGAKRDALNDRARESRLAYESEVRGILDRYRPAIESHPEDVARKAESRRKTQEMKAQMVAVSAPSIHKDPVEPAEAATPAVVAESIQKSARNTEFNPVEAKKWLLGEIDKAVASVPAENAELGVELARYKSAAYEKETTRQFGVKEFKARRNSNIDRLSKQIGFVTFDVPGDGKFKVVNSVEKLQEFRKKVEASPGFKEPAKKPPGPSRDVVQGSYTPRDAILEGDYLNAYELAKAQGKPLVFSVSANDEPSVYTDSATADGVIDGLAFIVARQAVKDGKWYVIDPSTGLLVNKNGMPTKAAALTAATAKVKGHEDKLRALIADPAKAMPQSSLEAAWLKWAEEKEGRSLDEEQDAEAENLASENPEPSPIGLTPKQFHEARMKWVAQEYGLSDAEVRQDYDTDAAKKSDDDLWVSAVRQAFKDGTELTRSTLDKLEELRPGAFMSNLHDYPEAKIPAGYQLPAARKAEKEADDAKRESRSEVAQPSDLANIFAGLSSRGLAKTRAQKAAQAHPRAEQIAYVQDNFLDILTELEDSGIVKINCD